MAYYADGIVNASRVGISDAGLRTSGTSAAHWRRPAYAVLPARRISGSDDHLLNGYAVEGSQSPSTFIVLY